MQNLSDGERREVLGEVLFDELKVINEYVKDLPKIEKKVSKMEKTLEHVVSRLNVIEQVVREHEVELRQLKARLA